MVLRVRGEVSRSRPLGDAEGADFAHVEGEVEGDALSGALRGSLRARIRQDGARDVELHALVTTPEGAGVVLSGSGRASADGVVALVPAFEAQDARLRHLAGLVCIGTGRWDAKTGGLRLEVRVAGGAG
jgi:hypothetical protein